METDQIYFYLLLYLDMPKYTHIELLLISVFSIYIIIHISELHIYFPKYKY